MRSDRLIGRRSAGALLPAGASCRRSGAQGQPLSAAPAARSERATWRCSASMWVLMIVLASCQDVAEETGQIEAVSFEPGYPSLHTVPPRPQLSYTIEQRRTIVDRLIADRANARYSSDVVRYRAGLSSLPPPAAPALAVPLEPEPEAADAADTVTLPVPARDAPVVDPETEFLYEDDDLGTFMEEMADDRIEPASPADGGPGGEPEANAAPLGTRMIRASAVGPIPRA